MVKKSIILLCNLFLFTANIQFAYTQDTKQHQEIIELLLEHKIDVANNINKHNIDTTALTLQWHIDSQLYGIKDTVVNPLSNDTPSFINIINVLKEGAIYEDPLFDKELTAFEKYRKALNLSIKKNDSNLIRFSLHKLLKLTFGNRALFNNVEEYAGVYKKYAQTASDSAYFMYYKYAAKSYSTQKSNEEIHKEALELIKNEHNYYLNGLIYQFLGAQVSFFNQDYIKGISYFEEAEKSYKKVPGILGSNQMFGIYNNIGAAYNFLDQPKVALTYFEKARKIKIPENSFFQKSYNYLAISQTYKNLKMHDSAYFYLEKEKQAIKSFNEHKSAIAISESNIKFETEKKEKENLKLKADNLIIEAKHQKNKILLFASIGLLLFGSFTFYLVQKNTKRKQLLAEKERALKTEKLATVLKEQELTAIDAMIEGQEKERQRIANDLHDDLGGLMTTIKWHFEALNDNKNSEHHKKTSHLLDEAYNKIRSIAHEKNSGVLANKGLLKAIKEMANTISGSDKLTIQVIDYGLDQRLENSLELTIFRVIQELLANIIKHAEATDATIHITNHDDSLNILVEDNGKGFILKNIRKSSGMGIHSIEKRIENLEGTITIESELHKGTTIIIDIPI